LGELGYGFAYRVLDAQHFGVAQRRRRVFLIGYLGDWRPAAAVLFESESLCRDIAESRSKRQKVTRAIEGGPTPYRKSSRATTKDGLETWVEDEVSNTLNCFDVGDVRSTVSVVENGSWWDGGQTAASLTTRCHDQYMPDKGHFSAVIQNEEKTAICFKVRGGVSENSGIQGGVPGKSAGKGYLGSEEKSFTIATSPDQWLFEDKAVAVDMYNMSINEQTSQTLSSSASDINHTGGTIQNARVRRLSPVECERLQGFPDNFTNIPYRKKEESPDGPRYKALGNSMAVPVMAWIGKRIQEVSDIINQQNNVENK
jgi:DNA (cytosine-5)-methyltransferase 1